MTPTNQRPASTTWPWGLLLLVLAALLLIRSAVLTWPERAVREWPKPPWLNMIAFDPHGALVQQEGATLQWYDPTSTTLAVNAAGFMTRPFVIAPLTADGEITSFAISPDGQWVATGTTSGTLTLWTGAPNWRSVETLQLTPPGGEMCLSPLSVSAPMGAACAGWPTRAPRMRQRREPSRSGIGWRARIASRSRKP